MSVSGYGRDGVVNEVEGMGYELHYQMREESGVFQAAFGLVTGKGCRSVGLGVIHWHVPEGLKLTPLQHQSFSRDVVLLMRSFAVRHLCDELGGGLAPVLALNSIIALKAIIKGSSP